MPSPQLRTGFVPTQEQRQVYDLTVDSSGQSRASEARERRHIASGDTVVIIEDGEELHIKGD